MPFMLIIIVHKKAFTSSVTVIYGVIYERTGWEMFSLRGPSRDISLAEGEFLQTILNDSVGMRRSYHEALVTLFPSENRCHQQCPADGVRIDPFHVA